MKRPSFIVAVLLLVSSGFVTSSSAQDEADRPVHVGIMGGGTIPVGILADATKSGWNLGALVSIGLPSTPFSLRIDAQWMQLGHQSNLIACLVAIGSSGCPEPVEYDFRVIDGTANAVYTFPAESPTKFYLIGGLGVYGERTIADFDGSRSSATRFGLNAGAGVRVRLGTLDGFLEVRYHNIVHGSDIGDYAKRGEKPKSLQFVPVSLGITF
jgi:hypothetical protein